MATRRYQGFSPFVQEQPPAGYYDPSLDAQQAAAQRGYLDLQQDAQTQGLRDTTDYGLGRGAIQRNQDRGLQDIGVQRDQVGRSFDRNSADLALAGQRGQQDYNFNVAALTRRYQQQGTSQRQQQAHAGVMRGGAMLQAAAKRTANEALDRQPLDTSFQRFQENQATQTGRLGEDRQNAFGQLDTAQRRLGEDADLQRGQLALQSAPPDENNPYGGRSWQDRLTQITRAGRENTAFGLDTTAAKAYQATGAGWQPPSMPSNEFIDPATGAHRQLRREGNQTVAVDGSGQVLWRRRRAA